MRTLTVFGRAGCHLCDEALSVLERLRADPALGDVVVEQVDIEADEALLRAYLERIPVIALDGVELYDFTVDEADLRIRLGGSGQGAR